MFVTFCEEAMVERAGTLIVRRVPARKRSEPDAVHPSTLPPASAGGKLWSATIRGEPTPEARLRALHTSPSRTRRFVDVSSAR